MDNITVRYEADTSGIDKVSNALDELKARERDLLNEIKKIDSEHGKLSNTIKTSGKTQKQIASELSAAEEDRVYMSKKLRAELDSTRKSIASLHEQADKLEKTISKGAANQSFIKQLRDTKQRMNELAMAGDTSSQAYTNLAIKAEKLKFQISSTEKTITTMASTTRNMDTVMGLGQGLTGTFTAATSAMALFSGENEELQKTFFKVQAAMQILNGVQMLNNVLVKNSTANIVLRNAMSKLFTRNKVAETAATVAHTTATGAETTATVAATVATKAWTMALLANPIFWIVGIIAGVIASISHFKSSLKSQLKIQNEINEKEKLHLEVLSQKNGAAKSYHDERIKQLNNELALMKLRGASAESILLKELDIANAEKQFADENKKNNKAVIDNLDKNKESLSNYLDILDALNSKKNKKTRFRIEIEGSDPVRGTVEELTKFVQEKIDILQKNIGEATNATELSANSELKTAEVKHRMAIQELKDVVTLANIRLEEARKVSDEELKLRLESLEKKKALDLSAEGLSAAERKKIEFDYLESVRKTQEDFSKQQLQDERAGIEARMALTKDGSIERFNLQRALLANQLKIDTENEKLTANERLKIYNEYLKKVEELNKNAQKQEVKNHIDTDNAYLNAALANVEQGSKVELELKQQLLDNESYMEARNAELSIEDATLRAAKIKEIEAKLVADKKKLNQDYRQSEIENELATTNAEIEAERLKNEKIMASGSFIEKIQARENLKNLELRAIDAEMLALDEKHKAGIVSEKEYQEQLANIRNEYSVLELEQLQEQQEAMKAVQQAAFDFAVNLINSSYESKKAALAQELEDLHHYYTTDEEEAKNNADLKLMSKEEMARKELDIKRRQAKADKEQAIFNAVISTITAVAGTLAQQPIGIWNIALAAIMAAAGAVQISKISSQPLPKYAKGRKSGKGEMAWVGERGPEIMWIPEGASIVPAYLSNALTPETMKRYDIPMPKLPQVPNYEVDTTQIPQQQNRLFIDYDKLGRAVADNVHTPDVSQLNVNMDEDGFKKYLIKGRSETKFLNKWFSN